jgi:galactose mutarotase-like enzyme
MPAEHRVITDVASQVWHDQFELTGATLPLKGTKDWSVRQRRLRGGLSDGVDVVEIDNGAIKLEVLPTRGMGVWRGSFRGLPIGWNSPVRQPVHPAFVNQLERSGLGWLAGFNELICRCGLSFMGPPGRDSSFQDHPILGELTLHGKIANVPAHRVEVTVDPDRDGRIALTGVVDECSMFGPCLRLTSTIETTAGSSSFTIIDEVTNLSAKPTDFELLYHTNIGRPFLEPGSEFLAPVHEISPRDARAAEGIESYESYSAPDAGYAEQAYYFRLVGDAQKRSIVALRNAAGDAAISLRIPLMELPYFTLWKNTAAEADGYVTGLEPGTNFPNLRSFERTHGRLQTLAPGATRRMSFELAIHVGRPQVQRLAEEIQELQRATTVALSRHPLREYSPAGK